MSQHFLKELVSNIDNNANLVLINKKTNNEAIDYLLSKILSEREEEIILISLTRSSAEILKNIDSDKLKIIDGFSDSSDKIEKAIFIGNRCSLTKIQIGVEKALSKVKKESIIIIDSLNILSLYNDIEELSKFIYLFSNKTRLEGNSAIFFLDKKTFDPETLEKVKSFSDNSFDYSNLSNLKIEIEN